jgi:hypothetical protein
MFNQYEDHNNGPAGEKSRAKGECEGQFKRVRSARFRGLFCSCWSIVFLLLCVLVWTVGTISLGPRVVQAQEPAETEVQDSNDVKVEEEAAEETEAEGENPAEKADSDAVQAEIDKALAANYGGGGSGEGGKADGAAGEVDGTSAGESGNESG